jgi:hypothetical protein
MNDEAIEPDALEALLGPTVVTESSSLREGIRARTEALLRRRRRLRTFMRGGAVAAVFLVGIGIGRESSPRPPSIVLTDGVPAHEVVIVPVLIPVVGGEPTPVSEPSNEFASAREAEMRAEQADDRHEAGRVYRLAGDKYLLVQDYRNAARCYRLFLTRADASALQPEAQDNWLLTSLKNAAFQEKFNVSKTDG